MPEYVLSRIKEIMNETGMKDIMRVGLYGLTYKENVDDYRESPTLQLLEKQINHLAEPLKSYDPLVIKDIVKNQYHDFDSFINDVDMVIVMVKHKEIIDNMHKLQGKIILDTQNVITLNGVHKL
jgi:UDP-N-acetyl-D-mannosaminuronic acid dehydrogenase